MALPAFEWVKDAVHAPRMGLGTSEDSAIFRARNRVELEPSAVEEDGRLQMTPIPETISVFLIVWIFEFSPSLVALVIR